MQSVMREIFSILCLEAPHRLDYSSSVHSRGSGWIRAHFFSRGRSSYDCFGTPCRPHDVGQRHRVSSRHHRFFVLHHRLGTPFWNPIMAPTYGPASILAYMWAFFAVNFRRAGPRSRLRHYIKIITVFRGPKGRMFL